MNLKRILPFTHSLLKSVIKDGDIAIDGTAGNGNDTLLLAKLVGTGTVYAFDIQEQAIVNTKAKLQENHLVERVTLIKDSHDELDRYIPIANWKKTRAAIFNLGYLPGGNKAITTKPHSTIKAIVKLLEHMPQGALIILVIYPGHEEGKNERTKILEFVKTIDQKKANVLRYEFINQKNDPPFVIAIEMK